MKVALYTPMPPARTGVAHYSAMLIPALGEQVELEVIDSDNRQPATDNRIYQLGNNPHHEWIYKAGMQHPGVIVLHDIVLHHLIVEMTLARGDLQGYVAALEASHGEAGAAWARGRAAGLHSEMGNFLLPASIDVANRSSAVIVHNRYAADRLRSFGVRTPTHVVPHPYQHQELPPSTRDEVRAQFGYSDRDRIIGLFGYLTSAKRSDVVLEAFDRCRSNPDLQLLVVGEPAPNIDIIPFGGERIQFTGYVPDEDFPSFFAAVDRLVNLRYPTAGEMSGTLIRAFDAGKPVAVSDYAQFAELPDDCVVKIPFGDSETESVADFFVRDLPDPAAAQRKWLEENARLDMTVAGYLKACSGGLQAAGALKPAATLPLFPRLEVVRAEVNMLTIRNIGDFTLRCREYGEPAYQLIMNGRWLNLPRDLSPGEEATIEIPAELRGQRLELVHALQGVPIVEGEAWARVTIH